MKQIATTLILACIFYATPAFALPHQIAENNAFLNQQQTVEFDAEMLIPNGKNVDEEEIKIVFGEKSVTFKAKQDSLSKTFNYSDIKLAEYSYSKKPRYTTGAVLGLAVTVFLLPIMFTKSKKHWMTIQTEKDFVQLKLQKSNYRMIMPSFETKGVNVRDLGNQNDSKDDEKEDVKKN